MRLIKFALMALSCLSLYAYEPPLEATKVNGVEIYVLGDDVEEGVEYGALDQFWLAQIIKNNKELPKGMHLVDLRSAEKFKAEHLKDAINIPYDRDKGKLDTSLLPKDGLVVFYCDTGIKSTEARTDLDDELSKRVFIFDMTYKCDKTNKNCQINPNEAL